MQIEAEGVTTFTFGVREARESDTPQMVAFFNDLAELEHIEEGITESEMAEWFNNPLRPTVFLLAHAAGPDGAEGALVGVSGTSHTSEDRSTWTWMTVHPDFRRRGIGRALYAELEKQVAEAGSVRVHATPDDAATLGIEFFARRGFEIERYFWSMRLPAGHEVPPTTFPDGITVRTFVPDQDEELLMHVRNVTFAEHYGSVPRTLEEITYVTRREHFRPDGVFFAFDGDQIAGYCHSGIDPREWEREGVSIGHIHTLGVMPAYRGRGLGRALLLEGVNFLRRHVEVVELGVEGKNSKALGLYESVGFKQHKGWANMLKVVGSSDT